MAFELRWQAAGRRRGGSSLPVVATVAGMTAVAIGWFWLGGGHGPESVTRRSVPEVSVRNQSDHRATSATARSTQPPRHLEQARSASERAAWQGGAVEAARGFVADAEGGAIESAASAGERDVAGTAAVRASRAVAEDREPAESPDGTQDVAEQVAAHVACGEFAAARTLIRRLPDVGRRAVLFQVVEKAQAQAAAPAQAAGVVGELDRASSEFSPQTGERGAAGGSQADFQTLINLIMNETSGPWQEIDGTGGTISQFPNGVEVDPNGILRHVARLDATGRLGAVLWQARRADLNEDMARPSPLRVVSLRRLEQAVATRLESGQTVPVSMRYLAGLQRVQYVLIDRANQDVLLAGPGGGWQYAKDGSVVSSVDGRPVLQLDDLVTVLRTFSDSGMQIFGCSFNPRPEGLRRVQQVIEKWNARGPLSGAAIGRWARELQQALGQQDIQLYGVPAGSRVARVIIEADYRMKLIGIGKLDGGPHVPDYFTLMTAEERAAARMDALRWMLGMKYDAVLHTPDRDAFAIRGSSVLCVPEDQIVTKDGQRIQTGKAGPTNQRFAQNFTRHYSELAERYPVFADLQNIFDLALVAALVQCEFPQFDRGVFATGGAYQTAEYPVATTVDSVANYRVFASGEVVLQVAGGVRGDAARFVRDETGLLRPTPRLGIDPAAVRVADVPAHRWWWDARESD